MTETMKSVLVTAVIMCALMFIAGVVMGSHYTATHPLTNTVERTHKAPWNPHFTVCHNKSDHKCLWIDGKAWWVK